ncbi:hypothetical protein KDW_21850 [Dictyobacter vulcani]|uniref:non-specific serine/threonine protein kinase n=1 Tax=Dictyobacter vulcani TaxID=2607529 RepID=A0A5J4KJU9_9CHLR|nr:serine/threonine-protein kinase [Dictyobacter vulcani]GER88023.1 hypothetical protein KDW_21850 [Dictyobacter vulcani]
MPGLEGTVVKHYTIKNLLGSGGMSEVYLAYDEIAQQHIAIKVMTGYSADYLERFRLEAEAIDKLQHAHILPALDYEEIKPCHYLMMEFAPGGTLRELLDDGPLPLEDADLLLSQIASAVQYAHDHGVLHRDIKPSNILLRSLKHAYLADFGLAKIVDADYELTRTGSLLGTPEYMAPDLAEGPATVSSDVYSLGVLLYQILTTRVPFEGETPVAVFWKQLRDAPLPPSIYNADLSRAVDKMVLRALDKDPQRRYTSAMELYEAFHQALQDNDPLNDYPSEDEIDRADEGYEPVVLADNIGLPVQIQVDEKSPVAAEDTALRRRYPLSHARRFITSRPLFKVATRRQSARSGRRRGYHSSTPAETSAVQMPPLPQRSGSDPVHLPAYDVFSADQHNVMVSKPKLRASRTRRRKKSTTSFNIIAVGVLLFIILPASYVYYLYATHSEQPVVATSQPATAQPQPTATAASPLAPGALILEDDLGNNSSGRWSEAPGNCVFAYGSYRAIKNFGSPALPCALISPLVDDAAVQVDVSLLSGNSAAMLLRLHSDQFYKFEINSLGQYAFMRHDANAGINQYKTLLKPTESSAIVPGSGKNTLLVLAKGADFNLYINGLFLDKVHDATYQSGQLAFTTNTISATQVATASFSHLKLSKV